jgi:N-acetylglucosamine-6-phosphate deacetylase
MLITNCKIVYEDRIEDGSVQIKNGKITAAGVPFESDNTIIDAKGLYLSPGFIDIHIHGAGGYDTMDGTYEALNAISKTIVKHGTTSFLPTTMTYKSESIKKAVTAISEAKTKGTDGAEILGTHLEGPFINPQMIGAQNPKYVQKPSIAAFNNIVENNIASIKSITLAPEVEGALELIKYLVDQKIVVSIGHSCAEYSRVVKAINVGLSHSTHLFNAMKGLQHREPGVVGAIFDSGITTEVICDGIHIAYPALRIALKQKNLDKVILVTDAMMACCMTEGIYSLGGQIVHVENGCARLENGALAGSVLTLDKAIKNVCANTHYALYEVIKMASYNPAKHCGVEKSKGLIKEGYDADITLFDDNMDIKCTIVGGRIVYSKI